VARAISGAVCGELSAGREHGVTGAVLSVRGIGPAALVCVFTDYKKCEGTDV
jgi:hypothetical protein